MSDNPYTPPGADLGSEGSPTRSGRGDFEIGQCLSDAWTFTWANFPLWLVALVVGLLVSALAAVTVVGIFLALPVITWGSVYLGLRMHDGGAELGDLFKGFSNYGPALTGMLGCIAVLLLVGLAGQSLQLAGDLTDNNTLRLVGLPVNLAVSFLVSPRLTFAYLFVVDQGLPPMEALRRAWEATSAVKWKIVLMILLQGLIMLAGLLLFVVGLLPALIVATLMWVSAYRQLVGRPA